MKEHRLNRNPILLIPNPQYLPQLHNPAELNPPSISGGANGLLFRAFPAASRTAGRSEAIGETVGTSHSLSQGPFLSTLIMPSVHHGDVEIMQT